MEITIRLECSAYGLGETIRKEWTCRNYDDAKIVLKNILGIPSFGGFDDELKCALTGDDIDRYFGHLLENGMNYETAVSECVRAKRVQIGYNDALRFMRETIEKRDTPLKTMAEQMLDVMYCGAIYIEKQTRLDIDYSTFSIDKDTKLFVQINFLR